MPHIFSIVFFRFQVYDRLMLAAGDDDQVLSFSTLAVLATAPDGTLIDGRIKPLIRLLRPDVSILVIISFFICVGAILTFVSPSFYSAKVNLQNLTS